MESKKKFSEISGVVFSTNPNFEYALGGNSASQTLLPNKQDLRVFKERYKGGKTAVLIRGFVGSEEDIQALAKRLKIKCGVGGSVKDGEIIIQGDIRDKVCQILQKESYRFKKSGS